MLCVHVQHNKNLTRQKYTIGRISVAYRSTRRPTIGQPSNQGDLSVNVLADYRLTYWLTC